MRRISAELKKKRKQEYGKWRYLTNTEKIRKQQAEYYQSHRNEVLVRTKKNYDQIPSRVQYLQRAKRYGLTWDEWIEIDKRKRIECCEICGQPPSGTGANSVLHIDHPKGERRMRGLLCHHCNIGLGVFQDNIERLQSAIDYLTADLERKTNACML